MGYDLHITRRESWVDEGNDILEKEWLDIVANDPELVIDERNGNCFAIWKPEQGEMEYWLDWLNGNIYSKNPDRILIRKMLQIAKKLDARVQGDEDELYDDEAEAAGTRDTEHNMRINPKKKKSWLERILGK